MAELAVSSGTWSTSTLRAARIVAVTIVGVLLLFAAVQTVAIYNGAVIRGDVGWDAHVYALIGTHFIETGHAYYPSQLAPYVAEGIVNIYPPTALYLFVPASILPLILWWIVPLVVIGWSLYRLRPAWWSWPLMALACVLPLEGPGVPVALVYGNTLLWIVAALFAAAAFRPGIAWAVAIKPTAFLFALPFVVRAWRGWSAPIAIALSLLLLPLWGDWLVAMQNLTGASPLHEIAHWPTYAIPLVAWVARRPAGAVA